MDNRMRLLSEELRNKSSSDAADWLIEKFPTDCEEYGDAIALMMHRSWKREDQVRLAKYYLRKQPFSSSKVYESFAAFMRLDRFLKVVREYLPNDEADRNLLVYHLGPVLKKYAKTDKEKEIVKMFMSEI
jgi:hypothetical protein